jgi:MFS family permease
VGYRTSFSLRPDSSGSTALIALIACAVFLNYVDRGNLATSSPVLRDQLNLSDAQLGVLLSAFFWSYTLAQPLAGWAAQRFDTRYVLSAGVLIWSAATALTAAANAFADLLILRVVLGLGESVTFPAQARLVAQHATVQQRGRANGLTASAQALGPTFGTLAGGLILAHFGWRFSFLLFGCCTSAWLVPWWIATRGLAHTASDPATAPVTYRQLLASRALWECSLGGHCYLYAYYFVLTWLPMILVKSRGFNLQEMAFIGAGLYALHAGSSAVLGIVSDRLVIRGADPSRLRKTQLIYGLCGIALAMIGCSLAGRTTSVVLLACAAVLFGTQTYNYYGMSQDFGGPRAAARWMGIQNFIGNSAGITAPMLTGMLLSRTHEYFWPFAIAAAFALLGAFTYGFLTPRIQLIDWDEHARPRQTIGSDPATTT